MSGTDDRLLARARAGDRDALEALLARHQEQVYRFGMKLCRDPADAEDVVQDTLLAMARSIRDFEGRSSLATWMYSIARSFCIKKHRTSKFAPSRLHSLEGQLPVTSDALVDPGQGPDDAALAHEVEATLVAAIRELPAEQRDVLVLRDVEGLTAAEVAEVLGVSVAAVKSRLHRARLLLRARVAPALGMDMPAASGCPDVLALYSQHLEGEISADVCAEMERHLAGCARCRDTCDGLKRTLVLCAASKGEDAGTAVPAEVQASVRAALRELAR